VTKGKVPWLKHTKAFILDLDGTVYSGAELIDGALDFIQWSRKVEMPCLFVTNNASRTPKQVAEHLTELGIPNVTAKDILTSSQVAAEYVRLNPKRRDGKPGLARVFPVGEPPLSTVLKEEGNCHIIADNENECDYVIQGLDRTFTYDKMKRASLLIQGGAKFIATNVDKRLPVAGGLLHPGAGSMTIAIETASGAKAEVMGKPQARIIHSALAKYNIKLAGKKNDELFDPTVLVIGDNIETDIMAGVNAGVATALALTGVHTEKHVEPLGKELGGRPSIIVPNLRDIIHLINHNK